MKKILALVLLFVVVLSSGCSRTLQKDGGDSVSQTTASNTNKTFKLDNTVTVTEKQISKLIVIPMNISDGSNEKHYEDIQADAPNEMLTKFTFKADKNSELYDSFNGIYGVNIYHCNQGGNFAFIYQYNADHPYRIMGYLYFSDILISKDKLLKCKTITDIIDLDENFNYKTVVTGYLESYRMLSQRGMVSKGLMSDIATIHVTDDGIFDINYEDYYFGNEEELHSNSDRSIVKIEKEDNPILNKVYELILSQYE